MYNFFTDAANRHGNVFSIAGADYNHIKNVLRMHPGDTLLVSCDGKSSLCRLESLENSEAKACIIEENYNSTELPIKIYLFQGLPKSDKLELIIQKCVELGVYSITPVEMSRSIVKLDDSKKKSRHERWQSVCEGAAKQSKRNTIPQITSVMSYNQMLEAAKNLDLFLIPYESKDGMSATSEALSKIKSGMSVGILIGPEGGFEEHEILDAEAIGGIAISLGKRILRTETAAMTAVGMCMLYAEMNLGE